MTVAIPASAWDLPFIASGPQVGRPIIHPPAKSLSFDPKSGSRSEQLQHNAELFERVLTILSRDKHGLKLLSEGYADNVRFIFDPNKMTAGQGANATTVRYLGWSHFFIILNPDTNENGLALAAIHELRHVYDKEFRYGSSDTLSSAIIGTCFREAIAEVMEAALAYGPSATQELRQRYESYTSKTVVEVARSAAIYAQSGDVKAFAKILFPEYLKQHLAYYQLGVINDFIKWIPRCMGTIRFDSNVNFMQKERHTYNLLAKKMTIQGEPFLDDCNMPTLRLSDDPRVTKAYTELEQMVRDLPRDYYYRKPVINMPRAVDHGIAAPPELSNVAPTQNLSHETAVRVMEGVDVMRTGLSTKSVRTLAGLAAA